MSDLVIHAGTIGNLTDAEFVTGTPEQQAAARAKRAREISVLAARKRSDWRDTCKAISTHVLHRKFPLISIGHSLIFGTKFITPGIQPAR